MNRILFLSGSRYSLFNCIRLAKSDKFSSCQCDIILFVDKNMIGIASNLKKENIFDNIIECSFINNLDTFKKVALYLNPKYIRKYCKFIDEKFFDVQYDTVISQSMLYISLLQRVYGKNIEAYLIEEGLSTYTNRVNDVHNRSIFYRLFNLFLLHQKQVQIRGCYVNKPTIMVSNNINNYIIPPLSDEIVNCLKSVFNYHYVNMERNNITFLGSPYYGIKALLKNNQIVSSNFEEICSNIVKKIFAECNENITYRKHAREDNHIENEFSNILLDCNDNIWELISKDEITDNTVLISFFSTAAFTPKLLYDSEPYVIFLYGILEEEMYNAKYLTNKLCECYKSKNKVIVPSSINEVLDILRSIAHES